MASILQLLAVCGLIVAVIALTDWRWALLIASVGLFVVGFQMERKRVRPTI